jgi:hypothetical protein
LNDVVLVEWDDSPAEKAVIVSGVKEKTEYEVFFPERKRDRIGWIGSDQIKKVIGPFNLKRGLVPLKWDGKKSGIKCPVCENEMEINDTKDLAFCSDCQEVYLV